MSTSRSSCSNRFSRRAFTSDRSSTTCLFSSLRGRCAAMVSARRPGSSMLEMEVRISGGIFLLSLTYWSNCCITARRRASISLGLLASGVASTGVTVAMKCDSASSIDATSARCCPSTSTFTVPSGSLSICRMVETHPTSNMSATEGSSLAAAFWATSMMRRSASMAISRALMLLGRPTKSGITMWGNTTTSRKGNSGRSRGVAGRGVCPDMEILKVLCGSGSTCGDFQPSHAAVLAQGLMVRRAATGRPLRSSQTA